MSNLTHTFVQTIKKHAGPVYAVSSLDDRFVFLGGKDNAIIKTDQRTGEEIVRSVSAHSNYCWKMVLASDYTFIASVSDAIVKLWNVDTLELQQSLIGHETKVNCVAVSSDSSMIVTGDNRGGIKI